MWEFSNALKQLRTYKSLNQKEFAEKIGVPRSSYCDAENGNRCPNVEFMRGIAIAFPDVNSDWLLTGEGTMLKGGVAANEGLSEEKIEWLRMLDLLDDDAKKATFATTKTLAKNCEMAREFAQFRQEISQQRMAA